MEFVEIFYPRMALMNANGITANYVNLSNFNSVIPELFRLLF